MTRQADEDEPYHRRWLHALEADATVPSGAMQVARIIADYAVSKGGRAASVSYAKLHHQTHASRDKLRAAIEYLVDHEWLTPFPHENGERITYALVFGKPGLKRKPVRQAERSASSNRSGYRNGRRSGRSGSRNGSQGVDQSGSRNATSPASGTEPVRPAERELLTSETSLSPRAGSLHAALAAVEPDVTERETDQVREMIGRRPGVRSAAAVMRAEIRDGSGPALVAAVRASAASDTASVGTPSAPRLATLCSWCSRPGHGLDACPERAALSRDPGSESGPAADPVPVEEWGEGREEFARIRAAMSARPAERPRVAAGAVYPDESRDVLPDDYGDGDHAA